MTIKASGVCLDAVSTAVSLLKSCWVGVTGPGCSRLQRIAWTLRQQMAV